jgi:hypothetical protein
MLPVSRDNDLKGCARRSVNVEFSPQSDATGTRTGARARHEGQQSSPRQAFDASAVAANIRE